MPKREPSFELGDALLEAVARLHEGLHGGGVRDAQARAVAEGLSGHEGEMALIEQVEADRLRMEAACGMKRAAAWEVSCESKGE